MCLRKLICFNCIFCLHVFSENEAARVLQSNPVLSGSNIERYFYMMIANDFHCNR